MTETRLGLIDQLFVVVFFFEGAAGFEVFDSVALAAAFEADFFGAGAFGAADLAAVFTGVDDAFGVTFLASALGGFATAFEAAALAGLATFFVLARFGVGGLVGIRSPTAWIALAPASITAPVPADTASPIVSSTPLDFFLVAIVMSRQG
jgi:hypothetical protein